MRQDIPEYARVFEVTSSGFHFRLFQFLGISLIGLHG